MSKGFSMCYFPFRFDYSQHTYSTICELFQNNVFVARCCCIIPSKAIAFEVNDIFQCNNENLLSPVLKLNRCMFPGGISRSNIIFHRYETNSNKRTHLFPLAHS